MSMLDNLLGLKTFSNDGVPLPVRREINYVGDGVLVADNPVTGQTDVTILSGATSVLCAALTGLVGTVDKASITCDGRTVRGDGGGGQFVWDAASTTAVDNATVFGSSPAGRWKRVYSGALDVRWFGAAGDGSTNDTTALQAAVGALTDGSSLYFPPGEYYLGARDQSGSDASKQLILDGLTDITLHSDNAVISVQTTAQVGGYAPILFHLKDNKRITFSGTWHIKDRKTWSTYTSYGQGSTNVPVGWSGFSGLFPFSINERCEDLSFCNMLFSNTFYGISVAWEEALPSTETNRSRRISVQSLSADDVTYPLLAAENGDNLTCLDLKTLNCVRPYFVYGARDHKIKAAVLNSIVGLSSSISRKKLNTANIALDMQYTSLDGYPVTALSISLQQGAYGDPVITNVDVKLRCKLTTVDATRERQYAVIAHIFDAAGAEITYSAIAPGRYDGITLDVDKGEFEHYLGVSPTASFAAGKKLPVKLITRETTGGAFNVPLRQADASSYDLFAKKLAISAPYYEICASDAVHSTYVYPIVGWAPWYDGSVVAVTTGATQKWRWVRVGATVTYELLITMTSLAAALPAGQWYFLLPWSPVNVGGNPDVGDFGTVTMVDSSSGNKYHGKLRYNGSSGYATIIVETSEIAGVYAYTSANNVTKTFPHAWDNGDIIHLHCTYIIGNGV